MSMRVKMVKVALKAMMGDSMTSLKLVDLKMNLANPQSPMVVVMMVMMVLVVIELVVVMLMVLMVMVMAFGDACVGDVVGNHQNIGMPHCHATF